MITIKPPQVTAAELEEKAQDVQKNPWNYRFEPFQVLNNIYGVGNLYVMPYLIDTGDGLILIDSDCSCLVWHLLENIRKLGFDPRDIKYLLITHAHYDHIGGARYIQEISGCKTWFPKDDLIILNERRNLLRADVADFRIDEFYDYESSITLGNTTIKPVHTPGHTPGATSFFFESEFQGKTYLVATHGGLGINGLSRWELTENNFPLDLQQRHLASLKAMREIPVDVFISAHKSHYDIYSLAQQDDGSHSVYIRPGDWQATMEKRMKMVEMLIESKM